MSNEVSGKAPDKHPTLPDTFPIQETPSAGQHSGNGIQPHASWRAALRPLPWYTGTMPSRKTEVAPVPSVDQVIRTARGHRVILDADIAVLYGVETRALVQAVKRNPDRFPPDFMFQLTWEETRALRSQSVTLDDRAEKGSGRGKHTKHLAYAFTEQGVAMLSSVLRSEQAIRVNIEIMRAFVRLRQVLATNQVLGRRLDALEKKYDGHFRVVFEAIRELMEPPPKPTKKIGFRHE